MTTLSGVQELRNAADLVSDTLCRAIAHRWRVSILGTGFALTATPPHLLPLLRRITAFACLRPSPAASGPRPRSSSLSLCAHRPSDISAHEAVDAILPPSPGSGQGCRGASDAARCGNEGRRSLEATLRLAAVGDPRTALHSVAAPMPAVVRSHAPSSWTVIEDGHRG